MKLRREVVVASVILLLTVVFIGAVEGKVVSSLTADEQNIIANLHMSDSRDGPAMILFPAGTQTVYVVFDYYNMQGGQPYRIAVTDSGVTLYDAAHSYTGSGTECITVTHTSGPIPPGTYATRIFAGGYPVKTTLWHVRPGGPGEISEPRMSNSPDGPAKKQFIEGTRTVWAVFDYAGMEGNEIEIKVMRETGQYLDVITAKKYLTGSGTTAISVTSKLIAGFPVEQYRTHVLKDGFVDGVTYWSVLYGVYLPVVLRSH
jgi:hypothetical protein